MGPYTIVAPLGAGGMGTVYRGTDDALRRDVAIKVLNRPDGDPARELLHEARAASSLSHPHICHVYQVGESEGRPFIAMEFVEGRLLKEAIPPGGLPAETLLRYGIQLADALAHAHQHGIIHRDLKTGNVVVTPAGRVKVLDFGLALQARPDEVEAVTRSHADVSGVGGLAGTLPYMAPELLRGQPANEQSDIWALGVMLYEMAAGRLPFVGKTGFELTASILGAAVPPLPARVPGAIRAVILRALSPDPVSRYQHAGELRAALETVLQLLDERVEVKADRAAGAPSGWSLRPAVLAILAVVALATLAGTAVIREWRRPPGASMQIAGQRIVPLAGRPADATMSPDGGLIAYTAPDEDGRSQIWVASLTEGRPLQITRSESAAHSPYWSSRGEIVFGSASDIWAVAPLGGPPRKVIARARNPSVSTDGTLAYEGLGVADGNSDIWVAGTDGAGARRVIARTSIFAARPAISPDGTRIAYLDYSEGPLSDLWVASLDDSAPRRLTFDAVLMGHLAWTPDNESIVFASTRSGSMTLWSIPAAGGEPQPLTSGAGEDDQPVVSSDGRLLAYTNVRTTWRLMVRDPVTGDDHQVAEARAPFVAPNFSPDGEQIVFFRPAREGVHVFVINRDGTDLRQVTTTRGDHNIFPSWSADGRSIVFLQVLPDKALFRVPAAGGESVRLFDATVPQRPVLSGDGARVALLLDRTVVRELADGSETPLSILSTPTAWSPDGRQLAGTRIITEGGQRTWIVVVCARADGSCREITEGHSTQWSADGSRLFFLRPAAPHRELWSIDLSGENLTPHGNVGPFRLDEVSIGISPADEVVYSEMQQGAPEIWLAEIARRN
jgi:eukaryotic-like serine/threonine-protein kinase